MKYNEKTDKKDNLIKKIIFLTEAESQKLLHINKNKSKCLIIVNTFTSLYGF